MTPKKAAAFLREHFTKDEQLAELKAMLSVGGRIGNLAHGIAVELRLIEHEDLEEPLVQSLKLRPVEVSAGYGSAQGRDAGERSPFAGQGPMYARMGSAEIVTPELDKLGGRGAQSPGGAEVAREDPAERVEPDDDESS